MNAELRNALLDYGTDLNGALYRFANDDSLYLTCLSDFLKDSSMVELEQAISQGAWDDAFTAVHALKGVAGNMGFVPLFHASAQTVVLIRSGRTAEVLPSFRTLTGYYQQLTDILKKYCGSDNASV